MNLDLIQVALSQYGLKEAAGDADNPVILQMAKDCGFTDYTADSISWCSLFINWVAWKAGYERSKSLAARSWEHIGTPVDQPEIGDLIVYWRDSPTSGLGHVNIYINRTATTVNGLGGNQGDMVDIASFPQGRIIGFRRLNKIGSYIPTHL